MRTDGPLFRGRYKSILIDEDAHLLQVSRYIHRNPVEVKGAAADVLETHLWSSYTAYIGNCSAPYWLSRERTYKTPGGKNRNASYRAYLENGNDMYTQEFYDSDCLPGVFGDKEFTQEIYEDRADHSVAVRLTGLLREHPEIAEIVNSVAREFKVSTKEIVEKRAGRQEKNVPRQVAMYCSQKLGGYARKDIADYFSLKNRGGVASAMNSVESLLKNGDLKRQFSHNVETHVLRTWSED